MSGQGCNDRMQVETVAGSSGVLGKSEVNQLVSHRSIPEY
jgi:hypothetical protein